MNQDEKRRLIYEILVEIKQDQQKQKKAEEALKGMTGLVDQLKKRLLSFTALGAITFAVKGLAEAAAQVVQFRQQMAALGLNSEAAAAALSDVQDIAAATGQGMGAVADVYTQAVQAIKQLGGTTEDAKNLTNAFVRSLAQEGKSAEVAAQQLGTLQFAMEKNVVSSKEFTALLKENSTFQQAAQQAMGKTTAQLIAMAQAGQINKAQLKLMLEAFEKLAADKSVETTFGGAVETLKALGSAFAVAAAEYSGLSEALSSKKGTDISGWAELARRAGMTIGGVIQTIVGSTQLAVQQIKGLYTIATSGLAKFAQDYNQAALSIEKGLKDAGKGVLTGPGAKAPVVITTTAEVWGAQYAASFQTGWDSYMTRHAAQVASEQAARVQQQLVDYDKLVERQKQVAASRQMDAENAHTLAVRTAAETQYTATSLANEVELRSAINDQAEKGIVNMDLLKDSTKEFQRIMKELREDAMAPYIASLASAFTNLFTGATTNAREFFRTVLQGFAQILAQQAALSASEFLIKAVVGAAAGTKTTAGGTGGHLGPPYALGGAFAGGRVLPFAGGGVVSGPTTFGLAGGGTGLMGESGPEAIMPLTRGRGGKLGVSAAMPSVHIFNNTGVQATAKVSSNSERISIVLEAAQMGADLAESRINRSLRTGYGASAQSIQRTYGLTRR